jgi:hypothetical protein
LHGLPLEPFLNIAHGRRTSDTLRAVAPEFATEQEVAWLDDAELHDLAGIVPIPGAGAAGRRAAGRALGHRHLGRPLSWPSCALRRWASQRRHISSPARM